MKLHNSRTFRIVGMIVMIAVVLVVFIPLVWLFVSSMKTDANVIQWPPTFLPSEWVLTQYKYVFSVLPIFSMLKNTVVFAGCVTGVSLVIDSMAAYAFGRMEFKGKNVLFIIVLMTMMIPFQIIMIPLYIEEYALGILDTLVGLVLPRASSAYGIYMLSSFFSRVPKSLEEAAKIDGLNNWQICWRIVVPLSRPALITLGIFHFMNNWNDLLYPMMLTNNINNRTLSAGLAVLVGSNSIKYGPTLAATSISILPLLILFLFGQRYFIEGAAMSGSKE